MSMRCKGTWADWSVRRVLPVICGHWIKCGKIPEWNPLIYWKLTDRRLDHPFTGLFLVDHFILMG
jgi:hypothetical protein